MVSAGSVLKIKRVGYFRDGVSNYCTSYIIGVAGEIQEVIRRKIRLAVGAVELIIGQTDSLRGGEDVAAKNFLGVKLGDPGGVNQVFLGLA